MTASKSQLVMPPPDRRWHQFSLRTLLVVVTVFAVICSIITTVGWWHRHFPSGTSCWMNHSSKFSGAVPHYFVGAYAINEDAPTVAFFTRIDDPKRFRTDSDLMPWLKVDRNSQVFVEGRRIEHCHGVLQLFVDDGSGHPIHLILDPADARKYFGHDNTEFTSFSKFADFWDNVLQKKYMYEAPHGAPKPAP